MSKIYFIRNNFWKFYEVRSEIDADSGPLGMYFDAMVVKVEKSLILFQIGSGHTVW